MTVFNPKLCNLAHNLHGPWQKVKLTAISNTKACQVKQRKCSPSKVTRWSWSMVARYKPSAISLDVMILSSPPMKNSKMSQAPVTASHWSPPTIPFCSDPSTVSSSRTRGCWRLSERARSGSGEWRERVSRDNGEASGGYQGSLRHHARACRTTWTSNDSVIQAYVKEWDTLRTMLARSEKFLALPQAPALNGVVTTGQTDLAREL